MISITPPPAFLPRFWCQTSLSENATAFLIPLLVFLEFGLLVVSRKMDARIALAGRSVTSPWDSEWRYKSYLQVLVSYRFLTIRLLADYWWLYIPIIPDELTGDRRRASITASHCTEVPPSTNRRQIISGDSTSHSLLPLCNYIMLLAPTCIAHALYRPNLVSTVSTVYGTRCSSSTTIYSIVSIRSFAVLCNLVRNWIPINR